MMSGHRKADLVVLAATSVIGSVCLAPAALSAAPTWNGRYAVTFAGTQKTGTSVAADKPEGNSVVDYGFSSSCSTGTCIATVFDAPPPKNPYVPRPITYTWNGSQWVRITTWQWDCLLPDGTVEYDPAKSVVAFTPQANGTLSGVFHTDISSGACKGNVDMPVSATPAPS
jgi:hypothetical protein